MSYVFNWLGNLFTGAADGTSSVEVPDTPPSRIPEPPPLPSFDRDERRNSSIATPASPSVVQGDLPKPISVAVLPVEAEKASTIGVFAPARNAPNQGINIKATLTQAPILVIPITQADLRGLISKLRPTKINANPPVPVDRPGMAALKSVFEQGTLEYLKSRSEKHLFV